MHSGQEVMELVCKAAWRRTPAGTPLAHCYVRYIKLYGMPKPGAWMEDDDFEQLIHQEGVL